MLPQLSIRFNFNDRRLVRSISYQRAGPYHWYKKADNSIEDRSRTIVVPLLCEDIGARTTWSWSRAGYQNFFSRHVINVSFAFDHVTMMTPILSWDYQHAHPFSFFGRPPEKCGAGPWTTSGLCNDVKIFTKCQ